MDTRLLVAGYICLFGGISSVVLLSVSSHDALSQLGFALLGVLTYVGTQFLPIRLLKLSIPALYVLVVALLLLTLVSGHIAKGAQRWIAIGPVRVQVSELAKPILALSLCAYVVAYPLRTHRRIATYVLLSAPIIGMVLFQPDLGSSLVLGAIALGIAVCSITRFSALLPWLGIGIVVAVLVWHYGLYQYQKERIFAFVGAGTSASSYNARQAIITVGSGKIWGRGIGHGVQTSLRFLPEHHTDFFFASYAEETGLVGVLFLLSLYLTLFGVLFWGFFSLATFDQVFRFGLFSGLFFQMAVHMAMNIGLSPVTGIPLPFLSSGGSSFVSLSLFVGLAMRLSQRSSDHRYTTSHEELPH